MKNYLLITCMLLSFCAANAQQNVVVKEYKKSFPTYGFSDPNPIPLLTQVYPYFRYDGFTNKATDKEWKIVELSNDYIQLLILPEIGGKIWAAIDKRSGKPFLYYNHTVKFRDIAMRGPWTSGGLEANYGIIGHTPNCATPVDYTTRNNADGSVSCIIGGLDLLTRSNWRMEINLPKDKAFFTTQSLWYNSTAEEQPYYHWMNAGIKTADDMEFIYPGNKYIGHNGEHAAWPVNEDNGKKISFYKENNFGGYKSYHVFGKYTNFFGAYYHNEDFGMARYSTHDDKAGKKIWIWGLSRQGMIWEKLLTDTDGQYAEVQSGRLFNQNSEPSSFTPFKHIGFAPYGTDTWKEYWYPVAHTKGMVEASNYGALNVLQQDGWLKIYIAPVQAVTDTLLVKDGDKILYNKQVKLLPQVAFADSVKMSSPSENIVVTLGNGKIKYEANPTANVLGRPVDGPADFDWNSAYGLYVQATELMDQKSYDKAEEKLDAAVAKDLNFLPALVQKAALFYRNMRYKEALVLATKALSINTEDGGANYYYGLINLRLNNAVDAKDGFDIAALTTEFRSAANAKLAGIYLSEKDYEKTILYAEKAIDFNAYNIEALQTLAVAYRQLNQQAEADKILQTITSYDALNHFADYEKWLWQKPDNSKQIFTGNIKNELPQETYAELAIWYYEHGCVNECRQVFALSPTSAEAAYWLAFLQDKPVDFKAVNPYLSFPFRSETAGVMEQLLSKQDNWLLRYQLALIYHDRNRIAECKQLLQACGNTPDFAPFYTVRAAINKDAEISGTDSSFAAKNLADLQRALSMDKSWRYQKLLAEYFIDHNEHAKALGIVEGFYKMHADNYIMGMLYAKTLMLNKHYKTADALLTKLDIIPFEGATDGRALYREAKLMQAVEMLKTKKTAQALTFINQAKDWPENLGVGKPYDEDIDLRLEDWMSYLCASQNGKTAEANALLQRIIDFSPKVDNTVRNFYSSNALVTLWAYEKLNKKQEGIIWIDEQIKRYPNDKHLQWSKATFEKPESAPLDDRNAGIIMMLR